jgi:hypothetical protein
MPVCSNGGIWCLHVHIMACTTMQLCADGMLALSPAAWCCFLPAELGQLRAGNLELAASLQVGASLYWAWWVCLM